MKNTITTLIQLALGATLAISTFSCAKAKERPAKINPKVSEQVFKLSEITQLDLKSLSATNTETTTSTATKTESKTTSTTTTNSASTTALIKYGVSKLSKDATAKIAVANIDKIEVLLTSSSTVLMVINKAKISDDNNPVLNLTKKSGSDLIKLSKDSSQLTTNAQTDAATFMIIGEYSITTGVLENETTAYNEKKSTLTVVEKANTTATHLLVGDEVK